MGIQPFEIINDRDFYYPISPTISVWLTNKFEVPDSYIEINDEKTIDGYNRGIVNQSFIQIYSNKIDILKKYLKQKVS